MLAAVSTPFSRMALVALCQSVGVRTAIADACAHPTMARVRASVAVASVDRFEQLVTEATESCRLGIVIYETPMGASRDQIMSELRRVADFCDENTNVFVVGHENDVLLYKTLLEEGVADYLVAPISQQDVLKSLTNRLATQGQGEAGALFAVVGARGGAGATTVATNLAWLLATERQHNTCLLDLDLPFGGVATAFDCTPDPEISSLLYTPERIADAEMLDRLVVRKTERLALICAAPDLERARRRTSTEGQNHLSSLLRAEFQSSVVDLPLEWNKACEELLENATKVVLVTTPDFAGIPHAQVLLRHLAELRTDTPIVVLNQVGTRDKDEWPVAEVKRALGLPVIEIAAEMKSFSAGAVQGRPLSDLAPSHAAAKAFRRVVDELVGPQDVVASEGPVQRALAAIGAVLRRSRDGAKAKNEVVKSAGAKSAGAKSDGAGMSAEVPAVAQLESVDTAAAVKPRSSILERLPFARLKHKSQ